MTSPETVQSQQTSTTPLLRNHTHCRVCKTELGKPYLNLGEQPLANALRTPGDTSEEFRAPLAVALCETCGLSQLTVVVDPEVLYKGYRFRSGTSEAWRKHCADLAEQCGSVEAGCALDIAANDGTMLDALEAKGWSVLGVDPEPCHAKVARGFWTEAFAHRNNIVPQHLVIAQNVLGHVDDPIDFLKGIKAVLAEDGQAVIEVPNVGNLIDDCAFDTIYHEHLSYWNGYGMAYATEAAGLSIRNHEYFPKIHGGSVRYWLDHSELPRISESPNPKPYNLFAQHVSQRINQLANVLVNLRKKKFVAWGASAKGSVMMNAVANRWVTRWLPEYVIDETAEKQGLLMPGVEVPIIAPPENLSDIDVIWVLSWNWLDEIRRKARLRGFAGKFLVTSPRVLLVD